MFPLAHVGIPLAAVTLARPIRPDGALARAGLVWTALGGLLPDLLDKPLGHLILDYGSGRLWAHSLAFLLLLAVPALLLRAPAARAAFVGLAFGVLTHLVLDGMWGAPQALLWPLLGPIPRGDFDPATWIDILLENRLVQAMELAGLAGMAWTARDEARRRRASTAVRGAPSRS